jgi:hypothetical protein
MVALTGKATLPL